MTVYTRTNVPTPPGGATVSTFQVGTYNAVSDTWTLVLDLNDYVTWWIGNGSMKLDQPTKADSRSFNIRTPGERITKVQYKNRHVMANLNLRGASTTAMLTSIRALLSAIENPPYTLRIALPGATQYTYADVVRIKHNIPSDPLTILAKAIPKVTVDFECQPFFRGDRLTFQNLVTNPGFEAPAGGTGFSQASMPLAFNDPFSNLQAYTLVSGGAMTLNPANTYPDIVFANTIPNLLRYYRLGLADDATHAYDLGGQGQTGTPTGSPTQQVAGLLTGDTDTCYTFAAASSQYVDCPTTGLPTGNASISFGGRMKFAANPASSQYLCTYGAGAGGSHNYIGVFLNSSGDLVADVGAGTVTSTALTTATNHSWAVTWDGTTLKLYVDGASVGTPATPGNQTIPTSSLKFRIAATANTSANLFYSGQLDEVWVASAALGATAISNIHSAAAGATGTVANAASIPSAGIQSFGSPIWGGTNGVQMWQCRFRWVTGLTGVFYLHRVDANNNIKVFVDGTNLTLYHTVGGTVNQLAQAAAKVQHEAWYWVQITQFPSATTPGTPVQFTPTLTAALFYDNNGAVGAQIQQVSAAAFDSVTAQSGACMFGPSGAALAVGGLSSGAGNEVQLFGPGGWAGVPNGSGGTAQASISWDQTPANTYPNGPVTSFGAGRIDIPPAGTIDARIASNGVSLAQTGIPVRTGGDTLSFSAWYKTSAGLSANAVVSLHCNFYTSGFALISSSDAATATGAQTAWTQLSGTVVTPGTAAYCQLDLRVVDTTVAGESAGATIWFDNVLVWNQTQCAMSGMPYCELRFPNSPAQVMLSGIQGDVEAPAQVAVGTYFTSWGPNATATLLCGRRQTASTKARLIATSGNHFANGLLDPTAYGGYTWTWASGIINFPYSIVAVGAADDTGTYHIYSRVKDGDVTASLPQARTDTGIAQVGAAIGQFTSILYGAFQPQLAASNTWTLYDAGQSVIPPSPIGALGDPTQLIVTAFQEWGAVGGSVGPFSIDYQALLPVDGGLLIALVNNPSNGTVTVATQWLWTYSDGLPIAATLAPNMSWSYSIETQSLPNEAHATGTPGIGAIGYITVNPSADPFMWLDPTQPFQIAGNPINQFVVLLTDNALDVQAVHTEMQYTPGFLYPR